jgi:5-methylcytosine-specific restriction endonuclease McrA
MGYKDPDKQKEFQRLWMKKRRDYYLELMGGACVKCGSTERLEFDHIDRSTKSLKPSSLWSRTDDQILAELAKCQILCYSCHKKKTVSENIAARNLQHGEYGMYKSQKCRCELCRSANAARVREQRQNAKKK